MKTIARESAIVFAGLALWYATFFGSYSTCIGAWAAAYAVLALLIAYGVRSKDADMGR